MLRPVLSLLLFSAVSLQAATRYVSHSGSNTPPYTTWETAANQIVLAAAVADSGDTIRVGAGEYVEADTIVLHDGVSLIGSGVDSTTVRSVSDIKTVVFCETGSHRIQSVNFVQTDGSNWNAVENFGDGSDTLRIANCRIEGFEEAVFTSAFRTEVTNNLFWHYGWYLETVIDIAWGAGTALIENNTFVREDDAPSITCIRLDWMFNGGRADIRNNVFSGLQTAIKNYSLPDWVTIENNLFLNNSYTSNNPIPKPWQYIWSNGPYIKIVNNLFEGAHQEGWSNMVGLGIYKIAYITNNIFIGSQVPIGINHYYNEPPPYYYEVSYNDFYLEWPQPYVITVENDIADSIYQDTVLSQDTMNLKLIINNMSNDPMFVDTNSYELQYGSPCIDAGHPLIVDVDGSRSDIGALGGPAGSFYIYQDLPPQTPRSFAGSAGTTTVRLSWKANAESDLYYYILFRSELAGVLSDSAHVRAYFAATDFETITFIDSSVVPQQSYFYTLVAVDSSLLPSQAAPEVQLIATDADDYSVDFPRHFDLEQNYPNPFNAATAIVYRLPAIGAQPSSVKLIIYNMLGQTVKLLLDEKQFPGRHIAYWDGSDEAGNPISSGVYLYRLEVMGIEYVRNKKMVLVK